MRERSINLCSCVASHIRDRGIIGSKLQSGIGHSGIPNDIPVLVRAEGADQIPVLDGYDGIHVFRNVLCLPIPDDGDVLVGCDIVSLCKTDCVHGVYQAISDFIIPKSVGPF